MTSADDRYIDFLELEFSGVSYELPDDGEQVPAEGSAADDDWMQARNAVRARSRLGPLFGVTGRDLDLAALKLAGGHSISPTYARAKRTADAASAALLLLFFLPLLVGIALAVRLGSRGPAIFGQVRIGAHGKPFVMLKFRTMRADSDAPVAALADGPDSDGVLFKMRPDPRITRVGRYLRRYSLDELPQLWNVLKGDMSLVGPRPALPAEVSRYGSTARERLYVKPGLTGLWQVTGRDDLTWEDVVRLDVRYVENASFLLDLGILLHTIRFVARGRY